MVGAVTGCVGSFLGVWNFAQGLSQRRVRLSVIPKLTVLKPNGALLSNSVDLNPDAFPSIEVTNLSDFPVTIAEVGFSLIGQEARAAMIPDPTSLLPKRLESRESMTIRATKILGFPQHAERAYATTACKHTCYGDSPALKKHRRMVADTSQ
jgi:hypothetical protein